MIALALLLLVSAPPTVGDTIRLVVPLAIPAGGQLRIASWDPPAPLESLDPPIVVRREGRLELVVTLVAWEPGVHRVSLPAVIREEAGRTDTLRLDPVEVRVASVLPPGVPDTAVKPRPVADVIPLSTTTPLPVLAALVAGLLLTVPLWWWWRRRGPPVPERAAVPREPMRPWLERWLTAGEGRTAAAAVHALLAAPAAATDGADGTRERARQALADLRFGPATTDVDAAVRSALDIAERAGARP